jgi:hypothetical protein
VPSPPPIPRACALGSKNGRANTEAHVSSRQGACGSLSALLAIFRRRAGLSQETCIHASIVFAAAIVWV